MPLWHPATLPTGEESHESCSHPGPRGRAITLAAPASAQFAKPEDAVKYRQSAMFIMGQHFGRIGAMVNGKAPYDAAAAADASAEVVADMAKLPWPGFHPEYRQDHADQGEARDLCRAGQVQGSVGEAAGRERPSWRPLPRPTTWTP
jgi:hypothetical protein